MVCLRPLVLCDVDERVLDHQDPATFQLLLELRSVRLWEKVRCSLVHEELPGLNETYSVQVITRTGECLTGFPDARLSERSKLVLLGKDSVGTLVHLPAISIDDITAVRRQNDSATDNGHNNR